MLAYFDVGPLFALGDAAGGQGVPFGATPAEFPWLLPEVEGEEPELDEPVFGELVFGGDEPGVPVPFGNVPQGEPLGLVPGELVVFGFTVEGRVLLPGVAGFVEFDPGTPEGEF